MNNATDSQLIACAAGAFTAANEILDLAKGTLGEVRDCYDNMIATYNAAVDALMARGFELWEIVEAVGAVAE